MIEVRAMVGPDTAIHCECGGFLRHHWLYRGSAYCERCRALFYTHLVNHVGQVITGGRPA